MQRDKICKIENCDRHAFSRGMCSCHYQRWRNSTEGERLTKRHVKGTEEERFWAQVEKTDTCWNWTRGRNGRGYGHFTTDSGKDIGAHRWAYTHLVGTVPEGMMLDHKCHNRRCVNPDHLRPITSRGNNLNRERCSPLSKTGRRGVVQTPSGRYKAQARFVKYGKYLSLGVFDTIEEAAWVAERAQEELIEMECSQDTLHLLHPLHPLHPRMC